MKYFSGFLFLVHLTTTSLSFANSVLFKYPELSSAEFSSLINSQPEKTGVILGGGPSGLLSALALGQNNPSHTILVIEKRSDYSRTNTVSFRPESILMLQGLGLFEDLREQLIFSPDFRFSLGLPTGPIWIEESYPGDLTSLNFSLPVPDVLKGDGWPHYAIKISDFEMVLSRKLSELGNVYLMQGESEIENKSKTYASVQFHPSTDKYGEFLISHPHLIIVAEGAWSESRKTLGIASMVEFPDIPAEHWCSGAVSLETSIPADKMVGHISLSNDVLSGTAAFGTFRPKDHDLFLNGKMTEEQATLWTTEQCLQENALILLKQETPYLSITLPSLASDLRVKAEESSSFDLNPKRSEAFTFGQNVILTGDSAGNGSPIGGLGISLVTSVYVEALMNLYSRLNDAASTREAALAEYSRRAQDSVHFWHYSLKK